MKYTILVALFALALAQAPGLAQISTFPYIQDFEGGPGAWVNSGTNDSWAFGTPAKTVINSAQSGVNCWVNGGLTGIYNAIEQSQILGPVFDFSGLASASITFGIWWDTESGYDGLVLQSSIDGGMNWVNVGMFGDPNNWYNDNGIFGAPGGSSEGWAGSSGSWVTATHDLDSLAGQSSVMLRFAFGSDSSVQYEGVAIDDIIVDGVAPALGDTGVVSIDSPTGMIAAGTYPVTVTIQNFGTAAQSNIPLDLVVDGGTPISETFAPTIAAGATASYTFTALADLSAFGPHTLSAYTTLPGDGNPANDGATASANSLATIASFPYLQDFESGPGNWSSGGSNDTWAFGTPAKAVINSAASGVNCWVNGGLTGSYSVSENSYVLGPIFDFSATLYPQIDLSIWWESEFSWDGAVLQTSIDGGMSWQNVGAFGDPNNWYTDSTISGLSWTGDQDGWTGRTSSSNGSGMWVTASHAMFNVGFQPSVLIRVAFGSDGSIQDEGFAFDDISIYDNGPTWPGTPTLDLTLATGINGPATSFSGTGEDVKTATALDLLNLLVSSPTGTYDFQPFALVAQPFMTGNPNPGGPFPPPIYIDTTQPFVILVGLDVFLTQTVLPGGVGYSATMPFGFAGQSFMFQAACLTPAFAITDGYEIQVQ